MDPLVEYAEGEFLFVLLGSEAVIDDDGSEVSPLRYKFGQSIDILNLFLFFLDIKFYFAQ